MKKQILSMANNGFTLMELVIVIIVMGVIASIALPRYQFTIEKAKSGEALQILESLRGAQELYKYEHGVYSAIRTDLDVTIPSPVHFNMPTVQATDPIASIQRKGNLYSFEIEADGTITCKPNVWPTSCTKMGF